MSVVKLAFAIALGIILAIVLVYVLVGAFAWAIAAIVMLGAIVDEGLERFDAWQKDIDRQLRTQLRKIIDKVMALVRN